MTRPCRVVLLSAALFVHGALAAQYDPEAVQRGRYLVSIAGCNDCHTAGYMMTEGQTPESQWLLGDTFGWRGPWGTTYGTNLRLRLAEFDEDQWVLYAKNFRARPPMPWFAVNKMHEDDLRAIYRYVRTLAPLGNPAPDYLPPGQEPPPPFASIPGPPASE